MTNVACHVTEYYMNALMQHNLIGKIYLNEYLVASGEIIYSHGHVGCNCHILWKGFVCFLAFGGLLNILYIILNAETMLECLWSVMRVTFPSDLIW